MKNEKVRYFFNGIAKKIQSYSPEILIGAGISGMISSTVMAVKSTPKAMTLIQEKKKELNKEELKPIEVFKAAFKCYIPSAVITTLSVGCIIAASNINHKRNAALATAYSLSESALKLYQEKVIETIGEKKEQQVRDEVAKEQIARNPASKSEVIITSNGDTLCYDGLSGRYFKSDIEKLRKAVNELNHTMISDMCVSLNDYYDLIGLASIPVGDKLGWNANNSLVELEFSTLMADVGVPCLVVDFRVRPKYNYE